MINFIKISDPERLEDQLLRLAQRLRGFWNFDQHPLMISYEPYKDPRTRSQNNLYWLWLEEMAHFYTTPTSHFSKDDMHDLMRHKFLGYEDRKIGLTEITHQLISTTTLKKHDMSEYMHQIEAWNIDNGLRVTIPADNEYMKYREARQ